MQDQRIPKFDRKADGLRGLAALNVVFSHYVAAFFPILLSKNYSTLYSGNPDPSPIFEILRFPLFNILYNGHFAVMVFFVLSGYVLTLPAYSNHRDAIERRFWGRYLRLNIPIFFSVLLAWLIYIGGYFSSGGSSFLRTYVDFLSTNPMNVLDMMYEALFGAVFMGQSHLNAPLWSIGTEFIGSLLLLAFFMPKGLRKWIIVVAVFLLGALVFSKSVTYLVAILLGAQIVRLRPSRTVLIVLGVLGIYLGGYQEGSVYYSFLRAEYLIPSTKNVFNLFGALFLTIAVINGFASWLTCSKIALFLGRISYPLYILHFIVLMSFAAITMELIPPVLFTTGVHLAFYVGVCIFLAILFERFVDRPAIFIAKQTVKFVTTRINRTNAT